LCTGNGYGKKKDGPTAREWFLKAIGKDSLAEAERNNPKLSRKQKRQIKKYERQHNPDKNQ